MTGKALSGRTVDTAGTRASGHGWLRRLAGYCWRYRRTVLIAMSGALAATVATAAIPLVQRQIIDNVIVTHRASIWPLAGLLIVAAAVNFGGIYLRRYQGGRAPSTSSTTCAPNYSTRCPGWTAHARTRCAPGSWSAGPSPT